MNGMNIDLSQLQACDRCHRRKTRCDKGRRPECGPCQRAKSSCVYTERVKQHIYPRSHVQQLERRIRHLEAINRTFAAATKGSDSAQRETDNQPRRNSLAPAGGDSDVANEVSFLSTSAGGDRFFLGPTSGIIFASLLTAGVAVDVDTHPAEDSLELSSTTLGLGMDQREPENDTLPSEQLAHSLVEAYLAHDHLCYPFLHPMAVRAAVDCIYHDPTFEQTHSFEAFMFNTILAISISRVYKLNRRILPDPEVHHTRAMRRLNTVLSQGGLCALQSLLLLAQLRLGTSMENASGSLWHIVGTAARVCFEMGLHREAMYRIAKSRSDETQVEDYQSPKLEEIEVSRNCFWSVFALDRVVSITLGRPLAICTEDVDAELPTQDLDESTSPPEPRSRSEQDTARMSSSHRTALFTHIIRYRDICGRCMTSLHRGRQTLTQDEGTLSRIRNELAAELQAWRNATDRLIPPDLDLSTPLAEARSSFRSKAWYELLYHNGILLAYRPSSLSVTKASKDGSSLAVVFRSAKQSITLYAYLFRSRKINCSWMVLHAVFIAGLSYIHALSRHFRERRRHRGLDGSSAARHCLPWDPNIVDIVNDCRACSNVLVGVSERCNTQKNCHEVFDRLSNALVEDAVESLSYAQKIITTDAVHLSKRYAAMQPSSPIIEQEFTGLVPARGNYMFPSDGILAETAGTQVSSAEPNVISNTLLAADSALQDCFPDLQRMYDEQWGDDAILQLSNEWLGDIDSGNGLLSEGWNREA